MLLLGFLTGRDSQMWKILISNWIYLEIWYLTSSCYVFFCTAKDKLHVIHFLPNNSWNLKTVWNTTLRLLPTLNNDTRVFLTFSNYIIWQIKYSFSLKLCTHCTSSWTLTKLSRSTSFIIKELNPVKGTVPQAWQNLYCILWI